MFLLLLYDAFERFCIFGLLVNKIYGSTYVRG